MSKSKKLGLLCLIVVTGFFTAIAFHYFMGVYLGKGYPYNTFLFRPDDRFMDFFNPLRGSFDRDPFNPERIYFIGGYFPFGYMVSFLFSLIKPWWASFLLLLTGFLVYLGFYVKAHVNQGVISKNTHERVILFGIIVTLAYLTYPVWMVVDRANFDIVVFVLLSLFVIFYQKEKFTLSAFLLSCAIAMKAYPAVLLVLFFFDRRYKEIIFACVCVVILTIGSLALFKGGLVVEFQEMVISFQRASSIAFGSGSLIRFNSSLYTALLFLFGKIKPHLAQSPKFNLAYIILMVVTYFLVVYLMWKRTYPFWAKLLLLFVMMIVLPQSSGDYRLLMLYPPLMFYLNNGTKLRHDWVITLLFALLFIPKAYIILESDVNIGILINPLLLIGLLVITLIAVDKTLSNWLGLRSDKETITG